MITSILVAALLVGCKGDTGFTTTTVDVDESEGNGQIEVTPETLVWTDLNPMAAQTRYIEVTSVGDNNLAVYEIRVSDSGGEVFHMEEKEELLLQPGDSREFPVTATLPGTEPAEGKIRVECNDPDITTFYVPLEAYPAGYTTDTGETP